MGFIQGYFRVILIKNFLIYLNFKSLDTDNIYYSGLSLVDYPINLILIIINQFDLAKYL